VLVPGQVEDDLSVQFGGSGFTSNLSLLQRARMREPGACILYKPHPDVQAGHRPGYYPDSQLLRFADIVVHDFPMAKLLDRIDAVHVLTSLTGFEALLRGREVIVHGQPFYAGWGLTKDLNPPPRRGRRLTVMELAAGALVLYPHYIDPLTLEPCTPEVAVERLAAGAATGSGALPFLRRAQGWIQKNILSISGAAVR
jgi:capsular polysaccharide export protein